MDQTLRFPQIQPGAITGAPRMTSPDPSRRRKNAAMSLERPFDSISVYSWLGDSREV
jgi:hypothetical protein